MRPARRCTARSPPPIWCWPASLPPTRRCGLPGTTRARRTSAGRATSTTRPRRPNGCATAGTPEWRSSTSTRTRATGRRRSSGTAADVLYASVHVDPAAGWYPHLVGHADEIGGGDRPGRQPERARWRLAPATMRGSRRSIDIDHDGARSRCDGAGRVARCRRGGRRSREPAADHRRRVSLGGAAARRARACRPCSCRRAATTCLGWCRWCCRCWRDSRTHMAERTRPCGGWEPTRSAASRTPDVPTCSRRRTGASRRSPPPNGRGRSSSRPTAPRWRSCSTATPPTSGRSPSMRSGRAHSPSASRPADRSLPTGTTATPCGRPTARGLRTRRRAGCWWSPPPAVCRVTCARARPRSGSTTRGCSIGVDRDHRTALAIVDVDDAWPSRFADGERRLLRRRGLARSHTSRVPGVPPRRSELHQRSRGRGRHRCTHRTGPRRAHERAQPGLVARGHPVWRMPARRPAGTRCSWSTPPAGHSRQVTTSAADFSDLSFTPDGGQLVGVRTRAGVSDLVDGRCRVR